MSTRTRKPLGTWSSMPANCLPVNWSPHAVSRYQERVKPGLERERVESELSRLLATAVVTTARPEWMEGDQRATAYLLLGDDVCLPLHANGGELVAATTLNRHLMPTSRREHLNRKHASRRKKRHTSAMKRHDRRGGRPDPPPPDDDYEA